MLGAESRASGILGLSSVHQRHASKAGVPLNTRSAGRRTGEAMYKNIVAAVLGINGLVLVAIGTLIASSAQSQLVELGLDAAQVARVAPTFYGLGLADASSSLFSLFAMVLVYQQRPSGRTLGLVVAASQLIVGAGLFLLTGVPLALYFIALRGVIIAALAWALPSGNA